MRRTALTAAAFAATLTLAGCGGSGTAAGSPPGSTISPTTSSTSPAAGASTSSAAATPSETVPSSDLTMTTGTTPRAVASQTVATDPVQMLYTVSGIVGVAFLSPSGNIACVITAESYGGSHAAARCDIIQAGYAMPRPPKNCYGDYGQSFDLTDHAEVACSTDTIVQEALFRPNGSTWWFDPAHNPRVRPLGWIGSRRGAALGYGNTITFAEISCTSTVDGMICQNTETGGRLLVSRSHYELN